MTYFLILCFLADLVIIKTLIEATRKIERELARADIPAHTIVFLRNDVYELLVGETSDRGKETRTNVDWAEPNLLREILKRRMIFGTPEMKQLTFPEIWRRVCTSHIKGDESSQYLIERSLMRPRFLIDLLNHCRGYAVNLGHEKIEEADIQSGLKAYSTDLLSDISLEMRDVFPAAENVVYGFIGAPDRFNEASLLEMISASGVAEVSRSEIPKLLLWFAFLGVVPPDDEPRYIYSYNYDMRLLQGHTSKLKQAGISYTVNPAFWAALGIGIS